MSIKSFEERQKARYISLSDALYADFNAIKDLYPSDAHHNAVNGANNERLLMELFNDELTNGFRATSGFIVDSEGKMSSQIDIIIYDDSTPLIFNKAGISIVPLDGVRSIVEVKSTLPGIDTAHENSLNKIIEKMLGQSMESGFSLRDSNIIFGVFAYSLGVQEVNETQLSRIFSNSEFEKLKFCIQINRNNFLMSFKKEQRDNDDCRYNHEFFKFDSDLAVGYFLDNIRYAISNESEIYTKYLFPSNGKIEDGKENRRVLLNPAS